MSAPRLSLPPHDIGVWGALARGLGSLKELYLDNNKFTVLPFEMHTLDELESFSVVRSYTHINPSPRHTPAPLLHTPPPPPPPPTQPSPIRCPPRQDPSY